MKGRPNVLVCILAMLLASCVAMEVTQERLNEKLRSTHIDSFVHIYGLPESSHINQDGSRIYKFTLGRKVTHGTRTGPPQVTETEEGKVTVLTQTPYTDVIECVIMVYADEDGVINNTKILTDTMGEGFFNFTTSRCMQIFDFVEEKFEG